MTTAALRSQEATKAIRRDQPPSPLGRGSAIPEISIAARAGPNTTGDASASTI